MTNLFRGKLHFPRLSTNVPNYMWKFFPTIEDDSRSHWPRGLRRRSAAARLLRLRVRIPPRACPSVCCECCVLSGRGHYDELITRPEKFYRLWCVVVCDLETSWMRRPWPTGEVLLGHTHTKKEFKRNSLLWNSNCPQNNISDKSGHYNNIYWCHLLLSLAPTC